MKFIDGIKFGVAFCIGFKLINTLIEILRNPKGFIEEAKSKIQLQKEPEKNEKRIIGFHM